MPKEPIPGLAVPAWPLRPANHKTRGWISRSPWPPQNVIGRLAGASPKSTPAALRGATAGVLGLGRWS